MPTNASPAAHATAPARRTRRRSGAVTLHDVAKLAGVAPITASRALNHPGQVSDEVRERVAEAVANTGYVPNLLAGGLASTRSRLIAAIVPTITGPVFTPTIAALTEALAAEGYQLMLGQSGYDGQREDALLDAIIGRRPDGLVLTGVMHSKQGRQRLLAAGFPVIETWDLTPTPIDLLVGFSHAEVGRAVADFLRARARQRLAVVTGSDERAVRRTHAFVAATRGHGLAEVQVVTVPAPTTMLSGRKAMAQLLSTKPRGAKKGVDAVFCSSDLLALGVMTQARAQALDVPREIAVVGFGDLDFAAAALPSLTTVRIDGHAIGRQAARFIVERAQGREVNPRVVDIGFSIVERDSA
jgi:LacI family gluconate utilization system Gnt-I transcriptional repressor